MGPIAAAVIRSIDLNDGEHWRWYLKTDPPAMTRSKGVRYRPAASKSRTLEDAFLFQQESITEREFRDYYRNKNCIAYGGHYLTDGFELDDGEDFSRYASALT